MLIRRKPELTYAEVTPKDVYSNRRKFLRDLGIASAAAALAGEGILSLASPSLTAYATTKLNFVKGPFSTDEKVTPVNDVTHYNNFYEFGAEKADPSKNAQNFKTTPWTVSVEGEIKKPRKLSMDEILRIAPLEERIYRHRCVERWSIVVPWIGYSLSAIIKQSEPTAKAKYVAFQTLYDRKQMPHAGGVEFPYVEGLRMDEAMHPMALLCVGLYGETL